MLLGPRTIPFHQATSFCSRLRRSFSHSGMTAGLRYLCILDFEATCETTAAPSNWDLKKQEIIEFPVLVYNIDSRTVEQTFHEYVKPQLQPRLTKYCNDLTGIEQSTVDKADPFEAVWKRFLAFRSANLPEDIDSFAFLTCGNWDLKTMLPLQLAHAREATKGVPTSQVDSDLFTMPPFMDHWFNIKQHYKAMYKRQGGGMVSMLYGLGLQLEGRHHSGIDDCKNIARVVTRMLEDGWQPRHPRERYGAAQ